LYTQKGEAYQTSDCVRAATSRAHEKNNWGISRMNM